MANRLALGLVPIGAPGNVEYIYAAKVGGETATLAHWLEKSKEVVKEPFIEIVGATEDTQEKTLTAETYQINKLSVRFVKEY